MKKINNIKYYLLYGISYIHALLPWSLLYFLSDVLFVVLYRLVRYRRKIVRVNLQNAFPEKSVIEIEKIERQFYHFLCDYYIETIKLLHISDEDVKRRMKFENPELLNELTKDGNSCLLSLGHYGNWEYVSSIGFYLFPELFQGQIYHKLRDGAFDRFFLKIRSRFSPLSIEMSDAMRTIVHNRQQGKAMVIGFINDQRPRRNAGQHWTRFLNQDTPALIGMERIARKFGFSVVYLDLRREKRGHYVGRFSVITTNASKEEKFAVTEQYMRLLEKTILRDPAYWLWSHKRWKFKRETAEKI